MDSDYDIVHRTTDQSIKYKWAKFTQPNIDISKAIMVGIADMQFKFSPSIYKKFQQKVESPHLGYILPRNQLKQCLINRIKTRYDKNTPLNQNNISFWSNTVAAIYGIIQTITNVGDQVLIICPTYYKFLQMVAASNRKIVEYVLETNRDRFYIDFDLLEEVIKNNKIKLMIFCSPWNPCGRIWSKQQLTKLSELVLKYKFFLLSDEIYSETIELTQQQEQNKVQVQDIFTSMLTFPEIYDYLIYVSSYSKAYNANDLSLSYSFCFNEDIHNKINSYVGVTGVYGSALAAQLMGVIYSSQEAKDWIKNTNKYIHNNYLIFVKECAQKLPKLKIYQLECSYLCLIDFEQYNLAGNQLKQKFTSINVCPTFMQSSYKTQKPRSMVRINLAINKELVIELVDRMAKILDIN